MKFHHIVCVILSTGAFLTSCQKEKSFERPSTPAGDLLVKMEAITGMDTLITEYSYDDKLRLVTETENGIWDGDRYHRFKRFVWDNTANRVARVLQYEAGVGVSFTDTVRRNVHYPDATSRNYDYIVSNTEVLTEAATDSSTFGYNGDQVLLQNSYITIPAYSINAAHASRIEFTYDAGTSNITKVNYYESEDPVAGTPPELKGDVTYAYSSDVDFQWRTDHAAQNYLLTPYPNKTDKYIRQSVGNTFATGEVTTILTSLVMGANGKPASGYSTLEPDGITVRLKFFYQ